jgi:ribosomal peptide maturation radical SAM protein 1
MQQDQKSVLLVSMPFAETSIPSIQLSLLEAYLKDRNINVCSNHLYLKASDFYGLTNYNYLINSPNDSYTAQLVFSKYVFQEHWEKTNNNYKEFYNNTIGYYKKILENFSFSDYVQKTDDFYSWACNNINWKDYDIIGFTLNYGQLLPSLAISKYIKESYPDKTIVFGGSTTVSELGKRVLKAFNYIDFIISSDGEEPIFLLASNEKQKNIPGLIYREDDQIKLNENNEVIDLNNLPFLDFTSFYQDLYKSGNEVQQYFFLRGRLPIEFSRGCWWNRCTFCNIKSHHKKYREKNIKRFVEELNFLSEKYKMLEFQFIGNTLPQNDFKDLCNQIIDLGKDFRFYAEARAGILKSDDYKLLKKAGFTLIQTGVESFSKNYLKKMNKGAKVIDNIAALKYCKENEIINSYNLIINYPNEEKIDFEETKKNIQKIKRYLDPPQISTFYVGFNSPIYENLEEFNIDKLEYKRVDKIIFPTDVLSNNFCFFNGFIRKKPIEENNWIGLLNNWKIEREMLMIEGLKNKNPIDQHIFYFVDGGNFIRIYDKRSLKNIQIYNLDEIEREIFLSCLDVISFDKIKENLPHLSEDKIHSTLKDFEESNILFREDDRFLSLPLRYKSSEIKKEITTQKLVYN